MKIRSSQYPESFVPTHSAGLASVGVCTNTSMPGTGLYQLPTHDYGVRVEVRTCRSALQELQARELGLPQRRSG